MIKTINRFDAAVNMVPKEGWVVLHIDVEDEPFYIHYDTEEEFKKDFKISTHPFYKRLHVEPNNIVNDWGEGSVEVSIKEGTKEVYLNIKCLHLIIKQRVIHTVTDKKQEDER